MTPVLSPPLPFSPITGAAPEPGFDAIVRLAARRTGWPIALINLHKPSVRATKAAHGALHEEVAPLLVLCGRVVETDQTLLLPDLRREAAALADEALQHACSTLGIHAYAGVPLRVAGAAVGTLCVLASQPTQLPAPALQDLHDLAIAAAALLEARWPDESPAPAALIAQAIDALRVSVMVTSPDGRIVFANARWRQLIGSRLPPDITHWPEAVRLLAANGDYPDAVSRVESFVAWRLGLASAEGEPHELQWHDRWATVSDRRLPDGSVVHLSIDASDRRRAEDALAEERARSRTADARMAAVLRAVPDLWFVLDDEGRYRHCSDPMHPALVRPFEEFRHSRLADVLPPELARQALDAVAAARATGETQRFEYDLAVRSGEFGHFEGRMSPMPGGELLLLIRDLTGMHLLAGEVRDKQAAELASRSKSEFLSRMSHEMRTPLNAVIGFAQLMRLQGGSRIDYVDHVLQASQHLLALIDDVLDLQQVEAGHMKLALQPLAPATLLASCSALLDPLARARGVSQVVMPAGGETGELLPAAQRPRVLADEQRLRQVLLNIGSNAIKYNRPAGIVRWSVTSPSPERVAMSIEDTGSGMTPDQQARLFQPFERLGRENSALEGSGLGLLIARRLTQEMGGTLAVHSHAGQGTRVVIDLPAVPPASPEAASEVAVPAPAPALRLLYVEDNRLNALLFEETLKQHTNIQLRVAEDGDAALALAQDAWPDVLVLDAHLPGASGYDVLLQLRALPGLAEVPAFMCSADTLPEDLQRAKAAGFRGYWTKPLDIALVLSDLRLLGAGTN